VRGCPGPGLDSALMTLRRPSHNEVTAGAAVIASAAALAGLWFAFDAANNASASLDATRRSVDAQTQPLLTGIPLGTKLAEPLSVERYAYERQIDYPGEVLVSPNTPSGPDVTDWFLSIPVLNAGAGLARITKTWFGLAQAPPELSYPIYVAPGEDRRLSARVNGVRIADRIQSFGIEYEDLAQRICWATTFALLMQPEGRATVTDASTSQRRC
jgi:hypothetical protein